MDQPLHRPTEIPSLQDDDTPPRASRGRVVLWTLLILAVLAGIVFWVMRQSTPQQTGRAGRDTGAPMSIVPETVGKGDIGVTLNALGTVTSLATVTIRSQISGYLQRVVFKEGDEVKKGDLIAEIDSRTYEAALAQAKGNLTRDQAILRGAQVDLARYQGLAAQNAVPRQQLDTQTALVAQNQGLVEADTAAVKAAEVNLTFTRILSPLDGRVGLRQVDQGNYVTPGDANGLVVITEIAPISVLFTVPEDNLQAISRRLKDGAKLPVNVFDRSGANKLDDGMLQTFDSQIDPTTGTIKLRAQFPNDARKLYPNQFVNVRLLLDTHAGVTTISTAAIQRGVPGTFVYLIKDDSTVTVRPIQLGVTDGDRVEVRTGLEPGDRVVIDGADKLREGAKIVVRPPTGSTAPEATAPAGQEKGDAPPARQGKGGGGQKGEGKKRADEPKQ